MHSLVGFDILRQLVALNDGLTELLGQFLQDRHHLFMLYLEDLVLIYPMIWFRP